MDRTSVATDQVNEAVTKLTKQYGNLTDAERQSVAEAIKLRDEAAGLKDFDESLKKDRRAGQGAAGTAGAV